MLGAARATAAVVATAVDEDHYRTSRCVRLALGTVSDWKIICVPHIAHRFGGRSRWLYSAPLRRSGALHPPSLRSGGRPHPLLCHRHFPHAP